MIIKNELKYTKIPLYENTVKLLPSIDESTALKLDIKDGTYLNNIESNFSQGGVGKILFNGVETTILHINNTEYGNNISSIKESLETNSFTTNFVSPEGKLTEGSSIREKIVYGLNLNSVIEKRISLAEKYKTTEGFDIFSNFVNYPTRTSKLEKLVITDNSLPVNGFYTFIGDATNINLIMYVRCFPIIMRKFKISANRWAFIYPESIMNNDIRIIQSIQPKVSVIGYNKGEFYRGDSRFGYNPTTTLTDKIGNSQILNFNEHYEYFKTNN